MEKGRNFSSGAISPLINNICYLMLDFYIKTGIIFSLRDKWLFEIYEVEITMVDCKSTYENRTMDMEIITQINEQEDGIVSAA